MEPWQLSAKFLLGTAAVIKKVGLFSYFLFLARATTRIRLHYHLPLYYLAWLNVNVCLELLKHLTECCCHILLLNSTCFYIIFHLQKTLFGKFVRAYFCITSFMRIWYESIFEEVYRNLIS